MRLSHGRTDPHPSCIDAPPGVMAWCCYPRTGIEGRSTGITCRVQGVLPKSIRDTSSHRHAKSCRVAGCNDARGNNDPKQGDEGKSADGRSEHPRGLFSRVGGGGASIHNVEASS